MTIDYSHKYFSVFKNGSKISHWVRVQYLKVSKGKKNVEFFGWKISETLKILSNYSKNGLLQKKASVVP